MQIEQLLGPCQTYILSLEVLMMTEGKAFEKSFTALDNLALYTDENNVPHLKGKLHIQSRYSI